MKFRNFKRNFAIGAAAPIIFGAIIADVIITLAIYTADYSPIKYS